MPDPEGSVRKSLDDAIFRLGVALAKLPPGPLARLRRASPGDGIGDFWQVYYANGLNDQPGCDLEWEWVVIALALLTPTGTDPQKRSIHRTGTPLGQALFLARVSETRVAQVLNATLPQRREALMRLVRMLARERAEFDTRDLARLLLFADADPAAPGNPLRHLAKTYYAAEAAAMKDASDA